MGCEQKSKITNGVSKGDIKTTGEYSCGNIYVRPCHLKAFEVIGGHVHEFDHMSIVIKGSVVIDRFSTTGDVISQGTLLRAGEFVLIEANTVHQITAQEDDTVMFCIYSHRNAQGEVVERYSGFERAYQ